MSSADLQTERLKLDLVLERKGFTLDAKLDVALSGTTILFGASGSGKSTILRCLAGLERAATGRIRVGNDVWLNSAKTLFVKPQARRVGYVFQDARLFPHLSVRDNLLYGAKRRAGLSDAVDLDTVVDVLGLGHRLNQKPDSLSGGESQRVAIGRAMLAAPRVLLMDEPLAALDENRKGEILPYIERLRDRIGIPIVYVTHSVDEAAYLGGDMALMENGRVKATGTVDDLLARLDLRGLTGARDAGTVLHATVATVDEAYHLTELTFSGGTLTVPDLHRPVGESIRLRIEARDVALALKAPQDISIRNTLQGTITEIYRYENGSCADVNVDVGGEIISSRIARKTADELGLKTGMPVYALIKSIAVDRFGV